jgi:putative hydrolase of HD superfamily
MQAASNVGNFLQFFIASEKLKTTLRHSWTNSVDRQESTAEHSWMLALIAIAVFDELEVRIDQLKTLKMVILHDLAEAVTGDIPAFEISERQDNKQSSERAALEKLTLHLPTKLANEIVDLWQEFEEHQTIESRVAQAIDKLEVILQHNISDISTWDENDAKLNPYYKDEYFDFYQLLRGIKDQLNTETMEKLYRSEDLYAKVKPEHKVKYDNTFKHSSGNYK